MSELIPFRGRDNTAPADDTGEDGTEITLESGPGAPRSHVTTRLPAEPDLGGGLADVALAPLTLLPAETQAHLRAAGREAALTFTSLSATLLKGAAIALNVAGETLREYTERHSAAGDRQSARQARQRVEIEVE